MQIRLRNRQRQSAEKGIRVRQIARNKRLFLFCKWHEGASMTSVSALYGEFARRPSAMTWSQRVEEAAGMAASGVSAQRDQEPVLHPQLLHKMTH